ncbi:hypothetical protein V8G54_012801 [Vigna mungo]|uniref:Integrase catalytic domain-containing protein n=1 Tax=Vigna mungo TaxID=3915 RepID=A0AAQ3NTW3_VIGMU
MAITTICETAKRILGTIARPLHDMLKKEGFKWTEEAKDAFHKLKTQLSNTPVLALPNFSKEFILEVDASGQGVGAVLMQDQHPIAYISRSFNSQQIALSTYEKELLGVVFAVQKWRHYLLPKSFTIRTDHQSLKYILDQRLTTAFQQKWLVKLMEFDFNIEYKQGHENIAADALSRIECATLFTHQPTFELLESIKDTWQTDIDLKRIITELQVNNNTHKQFSWQKEELRRKGKLVVGKDQKLRQQLLEWFHASTCGGHSGRDSTLYRAKSVVYWKGMTKDIKRFVQQCQVCQRNKYDTAASPGLLQPLPVPDHVWQHITMDFIEGLPNSFGKEVIFVVVERLSKAAHFMALQHPYTVATVAQCFLDNIFKLHGFPATITSDRDPIFISQFWRDFMVVQGVQTQLSTAYHPQTDGQTEVVNRCLETYLRCMCCDEPRQWSKWLPLAEWWYNTTYHSSIKASPYEIVYGQTPPSYLPYLPGESKVELVDRSLQKREEILKLAKFHMKRAQERMKQLADKHRSEREFQIRDFVYVKLHPYKQISVAFRSNAKLAPKYYGPYPILEKIGAVAYKLKKLVGNAHTSTNCPATEDEAITREPEAIIDRTTVKRGNKAVTKVLVKWKHQLPENATWEFYYDLKKKISIERVTDKCYETVGGVLSGWCGLWIKTIEH